MEREETIGPLTWLAAAIVGSILATAVGLWLKPIVLPEPKGLPLKTLPRASGARDAGPPFDYGTLTELTDQSLIDAVLGSGTWSGSRYVFPTGTGDRYFDTSRAGVIFYTSGAGVIFYTTSTPLKITPPGR